MDASQSGPVLRAHRVNRAGSRSRSAGDMRDYEYSVNIPNESPVAFCIADLLLPRYRQFQQNVRSRCVCRPQTRLAQTAQCSQMVRRVTCQLGFSWGFNWGSTGSIAGRLVQSTVDPWTLKAYKYPFLEAYRAALVNVEAESLSD